MKQEIRTGIFMVLFFTIITGIAYPLLITGLAQAIFPWQANGSQLTGRDGQAIGSRNIGQNFQLPKYFWGRPSATAEQPYNASSSGGSNLSVLNPELTNQVKKHIIHISEADPTIKQPIPVDLITSSASGLDPHISLEAALIQVNRVAFARKLPEKQVRDLVLGHLEKPFPGILGESRVNVLLLNIDLDSVQ